MYMYVNLLTLYLPSTMAAEHNHADDSKHQQFCPLFPFLLQLCPSAQSLLSNCIIMIICYVTVIYDNSLMHTHII